MQTDFELPSTGAKTFRLSEFPGKYLVLYFYPKDSTPGCTTESQQFRDLHREFETLGCAIAGVSRDGIKSHENFKAKLSLPFELLSDADEKVCSQFDVMREKMMYGKKVRGIERSTFLIGRDGSLLHAWRGVKADGHAMAVLNHIQSLSEVI